MDDYPMEWEIIDYQGADGNWYNTDDGDPRPSDLDIESSPMINVGWNDVDGEWHYRWIDGPFSEDYWIDDAIYEASDAYGIEIA